MFQHNLLLIYRNFKRFKSTFLINLIGLSSGLACALFIYLWLNDELGIDKFHKQDNRLFQAMFNHKNADGIVTARATPGILAEALANEMADVEYAVATTAGLEIPLFTLAVDDKKIKGAVLFAGKDYFRMFSWDLIAGDKNTALFDKSSILISQSLALKLFSTIENIIGKSILVEQNKLYRISGIFEDIPSNSSDKFDFVLSFEDLQDKYPSLKGWGNTAPSTYVLLREGINVIDFNSKISGFIKSKDAQSNAQVFLRPYSDKYLYNKFENGVQAGGRIVYVKLFSIIALFIVVIACINFMNLSTAKASRRVKEVGVKKAIGAGRKTLVIQYLEEALLIAFVSLIFAVITVWVLLPGFNEITGKQLSLTLNSNLILSVLSITILAGLIAGSYPAFYLSGLSTLKALKGKFNTSAGELWTRKGLVVFQFTLSVILMVSVVVVYKQIQYIQTKNLGYDKENVIYFQKEGRVRENLETFLSEIKRIPGIVNASSTSHTLLGEQMNTSALQWGGKDPDSVIPFEVVKVDYGMIETLGIEIIEGRAFSKIFNSENTKIIFNEVAIAAMSIKDPVGKVINLFGNNMEIVGVAKDFNFASLHENVKPMFFLLLPLETEKIIAKIEAGKEREVIERLQKFYAGYNPGFQFEYKFLDQDYQALYQAETRVGILSRYFAAQAIVISCLGLFGLAAFTTERKRKEIGIRKVLGASEIGIIYLLSNDFTKMVVASICLALPLSYVLIKYWLDNFAYRIELHWWYFIGAGLGALFISWLTVGIQTIRAAIVNPTESLKNE